VNELRLAYEINHELSAQQQIQGHALAIQNVIEGGTDIYTIRAILNEDVIDDIELVSASRKASNHFQSESPKSFTGAVYPNPGKDQITYVCSEKDDPNATLKITDAFGKLVFTCKIQNGIAIINTSYFDPGIYLYRCTLQDGTQQSDRFTIIK
jgi:hypothetical protein